MTLTVRADSPESDLRNYYHALYGAWGPQHWWPGRTPFEVIVGAFLTQNTSWTNVEHALRRLRAAGKLNLEGIRSMELPELESLIRSAGYFGQKARSLKQFVAFVDHGYAGSLNRMFSQPTEKLRNELLELKGVGPETADSILLYAGQHPVFVVDAYTRRILERHKILPAKAKYDEIRSLVERSLRPLADESNGKTPETRNLKLETPRRHRPSPMSLAERQPLAQIFNEMHGLIVQVGKSHCFKSKPSCENCPLRPFLPII